MTDFKTQAGNILISKPTRPSYDPYCNSIILVAQHTKQGAWGIVLNKRSKKILIEDVMISAGIDCSLKDNIYLGGPVEPSRVHVVHSMDWFSQSTLRISDTLGVTGDKSILSAISTGEGPGVYRVGIGLAVWAADQLEDQLSTVSDRQWLTIPATIQTAFYKDGLIQWENCINECISQRITKYF